MSLTSDIYDVVAPVITGTVIWADLNKPRPPLPYTVLKINSLRLIKMDHYDNPDNAGIQKVTGDREFTLSVQHFGTYNNVEFLTDFANKLRLTSVIDKFMGKKLVAFDTSDVLDISQLIDENAIERRSSVDVFMRMKSRLIDDVGVIDQVDILADDDSLAPNFNIIVVDI